MGRAVRHPYADLERLLQELEAQGVDSTVIEDFVRRALARGEPGNASPDPRTAL